MNETTIPTPGSAEAAPAAAPGARRPARPSHKVGAAALGLTFAVAGVACSSSKSNTSTGSTTAGSGAKLAAATLNGDGSTFQRAFEEAGIAGFQIAQPDITINYEANGSGQGKQDLGNQIKDFAGTDSLLKDNEKASMKGGKYLYFPLVSAPITVSYNEPTLKNLKLSPATLAKIFSGKIKTWNDAAIAADNQGVTLPTDAIVIVHRAEKSGTTSNFTKFLAAAAPADWTLGHGDSIVWPDSQSGSGNGGVAQKISSTKGAIGYVDFSDALKAKLVAASIKNANGEFMAPSLDGASKAVAGAEVAADLTYDPINAKGAGVYPITSPTWMLVYAKQTSKAKGDALKAYLKYLLTDGQKLAQPSNFAPLPDTLATKAVAQLDQITVPTS